MLWKPPAGESRKPEGHPWKRQQKGSPGGKSLIFHGGIPRNGGASALSFQGFLVGVCLFFLRTWGNMNPDTLYLRRGNLGELRRGQEWRSGGHQRKLPGHDNGLYWSLRPSTEMRILSWSATVGNQSEPPMLDREGADVNGGKATHPGAFTYQPGEELRIEALI